MSALAERKRAATAVASAAGLATAAAMATDIARPFSYDEAVTVKNFVEGTPSVWWSFSHQVVWNNHPFFSFLERLVWGITGSASPMTMRVLPITLAASAVVVLTWQAFRRLGPVPAIVAGLALGANPMFFDNARVVRGYGLVVLCVVVVTTMLARLLERPRPQNGAEVAYAATIGIALATHLYSVFVLLGHAAYVIGRRRFKAKWVWR